jgi:hypothetical protein
MQGPAPIPVFRPSKLTDGPEFQGSLVESPANVFYQTITASRATLNHMQFQWRSVSDNLLVSPVARLRFQLIIRCPILWTQITAALSLQGRCGAFSAGNYVASWCSDGKYTEPVSRLRRRGRAHELLLEHHIELQRYEPEP